MADDVMLWFIIAAAVAFIGCGCILTARKKPLGTAADTFDRKIDRAA